AALELRRIPSILPRVPLGIVTNAAGTRLYVAYSDFHVAMYDLCQSRFVYTQPLGNNPYGVAVDSTDTRMFVTTPGNGSLNVIDASTGNVLATVNLGLAVYGVALNPANSKAFVTAWNNEALIEVDITTNATRTVRVSPQPLGVAVHPNGSKIY